MCWVATLQLIVPNSGLGGHCTTVSNPGRGETGPAKSPPTLREQAMVPNTIFTAGTKVVLEGVLKPGYTLKGEGILAALGPWDHTG